MSMKRKLQVFISSTYTDLIDERQAAVGAVLKAGHIPAGMELFTSGDESQMTTIKRWIDESDIYMLILGGRYGSIEPTTSLSYTELEYDYAISIGKPYFAVVITDLALEKKVKDIGTKVIELDSIKELKMFREKVLSKTSAFFEDSRDIKLAVHETIGDLLNRYDFKGWISGAEIPDIQSFTEQISKLRDENSKLSLDNSELKKSLSTVSNGASQPDYAELFHKLEVVRLRIQFDAMTSKDKNINNLDLESLKSILNLPKNIAGKNSAPVSIITFLKSFSDKLITGVYNRQEMTAIDRLLYFNVMPKLQTYGLAETRSVPQVAYRRFALTPQGVSLLRYIRDNDL